MQKKSVEVVAVQEFIGPFSNEIRTQAIEALEKGKILYFPELPFSLGTDEKPFLDPQKTDPKSKNISFDLKTDRLGGALCDEKEALILKAMIQRYAHCSRSLLDALLPHYKETLIQGRTSLRTVEIAGRKSSYRKDDTRLHVDSFPSSPVKGKRILRLFTNVNPDGKPRVWRSGESFEEVVQKMLPKLSRPFPGFLTLCKLLKITKDQRTLYDHYMLQIHNAMKKDNRYQAAVQQEEIYFPPGSSWMVYTDQVSHAATSGQHVFEQTFYLPSSGLKDPKTSPLAVLERLLEKTLISC